MNRTGGRKTWNSIKQIWESKSKHHKASIKESRALNALSLRPENVKNKTVARRAFYYLPETIKTSVLQDFTDAINIREKEDNKLKDPGHIFYTSDLNRFKQHLEKTQYTPSKKKNLVYSPPKIVNPITRTRKHSNSKNKAKQQLIFAEGKKKKSNTRKKLK